MLSFKHQNVMSLIGLCLDGDVPLIIMPFMSDGNILDYVRKNRQHLYLTEESSQEKVIVAMHTCFVCISSFTIIVKVNLRSPGPRKSAGMHAYANTGHCNKSPTIICGQSTRRVCVVHRIRMRTAKITFLS